MSIFPTRREFLQSSVAAGAALAIAQNHDACGESPQGNLEIAPFRFDVSPPEGHPLCGGWIKPVVGHDDRLEAIGYVLRGAGEPIVCCAVDWTGILNQAHIQWRTVLAQAAGTTPERVAVQCVHQHNAPFVCLEAERLLRKHNTGLTNVDVDFFERCLQQGAEAIRTALREPRPITHVAHSQAKVERIASNRRIPGPDGKLISWRGSSSRNPEHKKLPEGLIDPMLKTVAFYEGEQKLVACHYYATHPMSYYGDGRVFSEFVGAARKRLTAEEPGCTHIYFTGCAGNIAAGKYNDGSLDARVQLTERMYAAMSASNRELRPQAIERVRWTTQLITPPVRETFAPDALEVEITKTENAAANRIRPAMMLAWLRRCQEKVPIILSGLHVNDTSILHLPAESFLEYQLRAQESAQDRFVAVAAYGDGGPWYIPVKEAYPQGGYEVSVAFCAPGVDDVLTKGIRNVLPS
jgi:hypothetical protein